MDPGFMLKVAFVTCTGVRINILGVLCNKTPIAYNESGLHEPPRRAPSDVGATTGFCVMRSVARD
jgi:hypothetical protein